MDRYEKMLAVASEGIKKQGMEVTGLYNKDKRE